MNEPAMDLSEIMDLYKEDARQAIAQMQGAMERWKEVVQGGPARTDLRRLSHQLRGSGRTYGFREVTRIGKAIENTVQKMERDALRPDNRVRQALSVKIDRLQALFRS